MRTVLLLSMCAPLLSSLYGCAPPVTLGAHALQPSQAVDTKDVWIYLNTSEHEVNGVWRCYDSGGKPVCMRAKMVFRGERGE